MKNDEKNKDWQLRWYASATVTYTHVVECESPAPSADRSLTTTNDILACASKRARSISIRRPKRLKQGRTLGRKRRRPKRTKGPKKTKRRPKTKTKTGRKRSSPGSSHGCVVCLVTFSFLISFFLRTPTLVLLECAVPFCPSKWCDC